MADDEEIAAAMLDREMPEPGERLWEWSGQREALARLEDAVHVLTAVTAAAAGGKPGPVKPVQRPETAVDRLRRERRLAEHRSLVASVLGTVDDVRLVK